MNEPNPDWVPAPHKVTRLEWNGSKWVIWNESWQYVPEGFVDTPEDDGRPPEEIENDDS